MTFCKVCGKLLPNVRFDPTEVTICQNCADRMKEDLVQVVRCKDCRNAVVYDDNEVVCAHIDSNGNDKHTANWFCADGVRKQED